MSGFFATNASNPLHWTLINSCFGALYSVWVHSGSFRNSMKLDAKYGELVQLMQKFVPRSHVGIFRNEPNPPHWTLNLCFHKFHCFWVHLLWFRNVMKLGAKRCELVQLMQKFLPQSQVRNFHNEHSQSAPLDPRHMFLVSCIVFGCIWDRFVTA